MKMHPLEKQINISPDHFKNWKKQYHGLDKNKLYLSFSGFKLVTVLDSHIKIKGHFALAEGIYDINKQLLSLKIKYRVGMWFGLLFLMVVGVFFTIDIIINPQATIQDIEDPPLLIRICGSFLIFWVFIIPIQLILKTKKLLWQSIEKSFDDL